MAPGRRKGASKAAAAAAARRQWKVGDLVLAKVKGFPAWPATVSEPEKWGYSSDWKKVLVYFFGTQQIAFCNHADVEPFTEEKKQALLGKRQGKGADFVRAVQEIIDCYEKLKKQEQVDDSNSGDVVSLANGVKSSDSSGSKDRTDTSESKADFKNSNFIATGNDPSPPAEDTSAAAKMDDLHDKESIPVQHPEEVLAKEKPTLTTYSSRKRSRGSRSEKTVAQQKTPSIQRIRNSSRVESSRFQNSMVPCKDGGKNIGNISSKVAEDGSSRKNKRIRKKTDTSQLDDGDSSASVSNGCSEGHGSEIATVDSDTVSFNEGSTVDSGSNREHLECGAGCLEGGVELSKSLDFQIKSLVKKKRKPNRKRVTNDTAEPSSVRDLEADLLVEMLNSRQNSGDNLSVQYSKEDGDEHLPLVKRARVRMGKISSADNTSCVPRAEENPSNGVAVTLSKQISPSSNFHDGSPDERDFLVAKGDLVNVSPSRVGTQVSSGEIPLSWNVPKNQYSCPADGEAALPPSKRLHRALEAMSANAAEEGIARDESSATLKTPGENGCGTPMQAGCPMDAEETEARSLEVHSVDLLENSASGFVSRSDPTVLEDPVKSCIEADPGNQLATPENKEPEVCNNAVNKTPDHADDGNNVELLIDSCTDHPVAQNVNSDPSLNVGVYQTSHRSINGSSNQQLLPKDDNNGESADLNNVEPVNPDDRPRTLDHVKMSPDLAGSGTERTPEVPPHDCSNVPHHATECTLCVSKESFKSHVDESSLANSMDGVMEDVQRKESPKDRSSSLISNDHLGDKDAMDLQLSPPSTDGVESMARVSPSNTSIGHISTFESSNVVQENGYCSPGVRTHHEKTLCAATTFGERKKECAASDRPRSINKCNNNAEVHIDLLSFEKMLGTLTRAKESILRATRTAIDCAKFGVSAKVVEILAHHLETETNLKKRIDLFFLVDSITQCSRGLKGDGGIYLSAIQAELPRLLAAAAPAGSIAHDNRRQCLKVLRVWLERKILPESVIRDHIREIHSLSSRSARTERAFDDPVREMEGMLMDEYGSNSSLQLPGFCMPCMRKDEEESDSDGDFEAVTPEHYSGTPEEREANSAIEKHRHILEDVDGELEMEDVAPSEVQMSSTCNGTRDQPVQHHEMPIAPPLPQDMPPSSPPPPPSSPPPPPPPPPSSVLPPPCPMSGSYSGIDSNYYNVQDDLRQPPPPVPPRVDSKLCGPTVPYQAPPDSRDGHVRNHVSNCNGSYNSYPARPVSNIQQIDGSSFHHQAYPPRPPYHGPADQFPYGHGDLRHGDPHMKGHREPPPRSYSNTYDYAPNDDGRHFYSSHERMKPPPYDRREGWNSHGHSHGPNFNGPRYPDRAKSSHGPNSYGHPPCEPPRYPNQGWGYPPREMNHRNSFPRRPPPEDVVGSRGPGMWWPR